MQAATGGADRLVDCVINKVVEFEHKELKKFKASSRSCFQMHPGICCEDPDKSKIVSFHKKLDHALKQICQRREVVGGEHLFLFAGYRRQRDADAAVQRVDALCIRPTTLTSRCWETNQTSGEDSEHGRIVTL